MNIKCLFRLHDWEQVGYVCSEAQLKENIRAQKRNWPPCKVMSNDITVPVVDQVCIRCEKVDSSLSDLTVKLEKNLHREDLERRLRRTEARYIYAKYQKDK